MPAELHPEQRRALKARAHTLKPVVTVGNAGLSAAVLTELKSSIAHHELMKVRLPASDRAARAALIETLCQGLDAALVQEVGFVLTVYRKRPQKKKKPRKPVSRRKTERPERPSFREKRPAFKEKPKTRSRRRIRPE